MLLKQWIENNKRVMVTTTAFGMGIDKPDCSFMIHYDVPLTMINYVQEIGRSGRDREPSHAIVLYHSQDYYV